MRAEIISDRGSGPAVVFVPGMDGTGELLLGTAERIEERFRLLRVHYVDEGQPGSLRTYERLADTLAGCLDDAGLDDALVLAESFGGAVALHVALRHRARVRALALVNTFAWFPRRFRLNVGAMGLPYVPQFALRAGRRVFARYLFFNPRRDDAAVEAFGRIAPGFAGPGFPARMNAMRHLDLRPRLGEIDVPCALFAATHDRIVPSRRTMATLAAGLPDAELEVVERANHLILPLQDEPWVERLVRLEERSCAR